MIKRTKQMSPRALDFVPKSKLYFYNTNIGPVLRTVTLALIVHKVAPREWKACEAINWRQRRFTCFLVRVLEWAAAPACACRIITNTNIQISAPSNSKGRYIHSLATTKH